MSKADQIKRLRADGMCWREIAAMFGVSIDTAKCWADPSLRDNRNERKRARRAAGLYDAGKSMMPRSFKPDAADIAARLAEIPPDTRDLTGFLMGDPLPQRSALFAIRNQDKP